MPLACRSILEQSSLANHMPGTPVKFRRNNDGFRSTAMVHPNEIEM
jgi:hypothetical protein